VGSTLGPVLQIVPVVTAVDVTSASTTQLRGRGFVEGNNSLYAFASGTVTDTSVSTGPNVFSGVAFDNDAVNLTLPVAGPGTLTVTTAGGTAAPISWNVASPALPSNSRLVDVASNGTTLWVGNDSTGKIHRINPATGAELGSFTIPVQNSGNLGLQILPAA